MVLASSILAGSASVGAQRAAAGPPVPFEDIGACPFEGCIYRDWTATAPVTARTDRSPGAPVAFTLQKGDHVRAVTGVVVTTTAGRVQFRKAASLWSTGGTIRVAPGDTLYLLTYLGEGAWTAWFNGRRYDAVDGSEFCGVPSDACSAIVVERPQSVWWVRLNLKGVTGWTNEPEKFDNKDDLA
jgi:hypothetical protein